MDPDSVFSILNRLSHEYDLIAYPWPGRFPGDAWWHSAINARAYWCVIDTEDY